MFGDYGVFRGFFFVDFVVRVVFGCEVWGFFLVIANPFTALAVGFLKGNHGVFRVSVGLYVQ